MINILFILCSILFYSKRQKLCPFFLSLKRKLCTFFCCQKRCYNVLY